MRSVVISVIVAVALGNPPFQSAAKADEAYVCEGGRVAYVRFGELEAMKRKDPCIAAYYGGHPVPLHDPPNSEAQVERPDRTAVVPLPVVRTAGERLITATGAMTHAPALSVGLKHTPQLAAPSGTPPVRRVAASAPAARARAPWPVAHPDTDFRNVRILNAAPGESPIFRHVR